MENTGRVERLLALILINQIAESPQAYKILQLNLAGFTNVEIADILQTTSASVTQTLYDKRKRQGTSVKKGVNPIK